MVETSRTMSTPGVVTGTMIIDEPEYGCTSGLVTAITIRKSATDPLEVNHLCPLITHSSPSRTADVCNSVGSDPAVSGSVNPESLATTAFFEYGLDPAYRGPGASTTLYDQSTPAQQIGSDAINHTVSASLSGLVPGALYHVRLVATNSVGTTLGPAQTFTTPAAPATSPVRAAMNASSLP